MLLLWLRVALWFYRKAGYYLLGEELSKSLSTFRRDIGSVIEIGDILAQFLKVKPNECPEFWIQTHWQRRKDYHPCNYFYFDAHYSFILWARKENTEFPVACIAFDPFGFDGICIRQIQGKKYSLENLSHFIKWERLLVAVVSKWAKSVGIRNIHIISAHLSDYYGKYRHEQMYMRYDVTARRVGLKLNPWTQTYGARVSRLKLAA